MSRARPRPGAFPSRVARNTRQCSRPDLHRIPDRVGTGAVARAGGDPTLPERELQDALCAAIADRRGDRGDWWVGDDGLWHVELLAPTTNMFGGRTLAEALAWCLVGVMGWMGEIRFGLTT
jgi:hypothetical protein